jgi:hypothetical protein
MIFQRNDLFSDQLSVISDQLSVISNKFSDQLSVISNKFSFFSFQFSGFIVFQKNILEIHKIQWVIIL